MLKDPNALTDPPEYISWRVANALKIPQPSLCLTDDVHLTNYQALIVEVDQLSTKARNLESERDMLYRAARKARKALKGVM